ncbi:MAG: hypothetical protein QOI64_320 [Solirubrobacteraceae bacterium]|jgi:peptidoglycan hydrolase-like protein with peptidoglycan-binding domain|nr:hypothetical protein [Solirubrobacteraceae bacterium]
MTDGPRDLACDDFWQESLRRSQARRGITPSRAPGVPARDLTDADAWGTSVRRSQLRREWRARHLSFGPIDSKRIAVPAALLAGGLAVTEVVSGGGGGSAGSAGVLPQDATAASASADRSERGAAAPKRTQVAQRSASSRPAAPKAKAKPKAKPVVVSVSQAQQLGGFKRGMRGPGVAQLQRKLGVTADGIYGKTTLRAVHRAQKRGGLSADGIVGPATWRAISSPRSSSTTRPAVSRSKDGSSVRVASKIARGSEVESLQRRLGLPVDGDFGARTASAVKRFQRRHGLTADGVVGPATWRALGLSESNRTLHPHRFGSNRRRPAGRSSRGDAGGLPSAVTQAIAAANRIATKPYRYGGGHGSFDDTAYDCSGSVSYVLHGAGLLSSPLDSSSLMSYGASGPGRYITIYANPGHTFMIINGRRFDTGYGGNGNRWASGSRPTGGYTVRHPPGL